MRDGARRGRGGGGGVDLSTALAVSAYEGWSWGEVLCKGFLGDEGPPPDRHIEKAGIPRNAKVLLVSIVYHYATLIVCACFGWGVVTIEAGG